MNKKIQHIFDRAEADRKNILALVSQMSEEKLSHRNAGKWSVSQILSHIVIAERYSLQYMKKKSLGINEIQNSGLREDFKCVMLKISQRLPLKYKAPKVLAESKPEELSYPLIASEWEHVRNDLKQFIGTLDDDQFRKKIYKHPYAGRLNVIQAISFLREHANHHLPQIKRLL
jgi:hypothetical protein